MLSRENFRLFLILMIFLVLLFVWTSQRPRKDHECDPILALAQRTLPHPDAISAYGSPENRRAALYESGCPRRFVRSEFRGVKFVKDFCFAQWRNSPAEIRFRSAAE